MLQYLILVDRAFLTLIDGEPSINITEVAITELG
jgi:hypothetical protein